MTVTTNTNKVQALGNGATKTFPYSFRIYSASDLVVTSTDLTTGVDTVLVLNTDYTVTGAGSYNGGNVVLSGSAPSTSTRITIQRELDVTQSTDLRNQGAYFAETHEDVFDKLTMIDQQQQEEIDRSLRLPASSKDVSTVLPLPTASRALKWNDAGTALENSDVDPDEQVALAAAQAGIATTQAGIATTKAGEAADSAAAAASSESSAAASAATLTTAAYRVVSSITALRALDKTVQSKATVTGYYADGDGGGGVYYCDAADTTTADNGGTVIVATDGGRWKLAVTDFISVKQFGAKGDGATNATAAIQAAATAAEGRSLYFPAGTYLISSAINMSSNTTVFGEGTGSAIKLATGDISGFSINAKTGVEIRGLKIYSESAGTTAYIGGVVMYGNTQKCLVEKVEFVGMSWAGVYITDSSNNTVRGCRFSGWLGTQGDSGDINIFNNSNYNTIEGNFCYGGGYFGIMVMDPYTSTTPVGNIIRGNEVGEHGSLGISVYVTTQYDAQTLIANNVVRDVTGLTNTSQGNGIYVQSAGGTIVIGNQVSNCCRNTTNFGTLAPAGIGVTNILSGTPVIVEGNIIRGMTKAPGIMVSTCSIGVVIKGNVIDINNTGAGTTGHGIQLSNAQRVTVEGNDIDQRNSSYNAINVVASADAVGMALIKGNNIYSTGQGISFNQTGGGSFVRTAISDNMVESTGIGVYLSASSYANINGNIIYSAVQPLAINGATYTRISNTQMITSTPATYGPSFSGTNTDSVMDISCYYNGLMGNASDNGVKVMQFGSGIPAAGTWSIGDTIFRTGTGIGGAHTWRCVTAGTPGTWGSEGNLVA